MVFRFLPLLHNVFSRACYKRVVYFLAISLVRHSLSPRSESGSKKRNGFRPVSLKQCQPRISGLNVHVQA